MGEQLEKLRADAERFRAESLRLRSIGARFGMGQRDHDRIVEDATARMRRPLRPDLNDWQPPRAYMVPGDRVAVAADEALGLLCELADAKYRAAALEAQQAERWDAGNFRLEQRIRDLSAENRAIRAESALLLSNRKRKANTTEAQRRKAGDRRRRNAR